MNTPYGSGMEAARFGQPRECPFKTTEYPQSVADWLAGYDYIRSSPEWRCYVKYYEEVSRF